MIEPELLEQTANLKPRTIEEEIKADLAYHKAIFILGSRRTGKTSLILRLIDFLIRNKNIAPQQIFYYDLESLLDLEQIQKLAYPNTKKQLEILGAQVKQDTFLFIDEIQYLANPASFVKLIYDHTPSTQLILSGSSSLAIKQKFTDSLAGRKRVYQLKTLSFSEFLEFKRDENLATKKNLINLKSLLSGTLNALELEQIQTILGRQFISYFEEYVLFGGYPETITMLPVQKEKELNDIYSSYIRKDIKDIAKIGNPDIFNKLTKILSVNTANLLNITDLITDLNCSRQTAQHYLFLLENTFIVRLLQPFFRNKRKEIVATSKIFFEDTGMRNVILNNFLSLDRRADSGALIENTIFGELDKNFKLIRTLNYWRTQTQLEVDFLLGTKEGSLIPLEVKYSTLKQTKISAGMRNFCSTYHPNFAIILNKNYISKLLLGKTTFYFLPFWAI